MWEVIQLSSSSWDSRDEPVCAAGFTDAAAAFVCRTSGFARGRAVLPAEPATNSLDGALASLDCAAGAALLAECVATYAPIGQEGCALAAVVCDHGEAARDLRGGCHIEGPHS